LCRSGNAWEAVEEVLGRYHVAPDSEPPLKALLPAITACFGHLSVSETIEALKKHETSDDPSGRLFAFF